MSDLKYFSLLVFTLTDHEIQDFFKINCFLKPLLKDNLCYGVTFYYILGKD